jgi:hypothetical protein
MSVKDTMGKVLERLSRKDQLVQCIVVEVSVNLSLYAFSPPRQPCTKPCSPAAALAPLIRVAPPSGLPATGLVVGLSVSPNSFNRNEVKRLKAVSSSVYFAMTSRVCSELRPIV